jgi:hypothetical protein
MDYFAGLDVSMEETHVCVLIGTVWSFTKRIRRPTSSMTSFCKERTQYPLRRPTDVSLRG